MFSIIGDVGFLEWAPWSYCSKSCGGGVRTSKRECMFAGACTGIASQSQDCNTTPCPGKTNSNSKFVATKLVSLVTIILSNSVIYAAGASWNVFGNIISRILVFISEVTLTNSYKVMLELAIFRF